jgi:hypothetical protein
MTERRSGERFDPKEAQRRFEAALQGAFHTPPKPMKDIPRKMATKAKNSVKSPRKPSKTKFSDRT